MDSVGLAAKNLRLGLDPSKLSEEFKAYQQTFWPDRLIFDYLDETADSDPMRPAIVEHRASGTPGIRLTYRELRDQSRRIALTLLKLGIVSGDVVSFQLPNWWQATALHLACVRIGAITNPLVPIFRERELRFMLTFGEAKMVIMPETFRGHNYRKMWEGLAPDVSNVRHAFFIGSGQDDLADAIAGTGDVTPDDLERLASLRPSPDAVTQLMYTSGTTGEAKGVLHSSNTLLGCAMALVNHLGLDRENVYMGSPVGHQVGFVWGILLPLVVGGTAVFQDVWDPAVACKLIAQEKVSFSVASTPFLADLVDAAKSHGGPFASFSKFVCAGAPIPRGLVMRGPKELGPQIFSCWGMTENGAVTVTGIEDSIEKITGTDGRAIGGNAVRIVDREGSILPPGVEGELQSRAPGMTLGYLKRPDLFPADEDGWMDTGDLAIMDRDGYIRITGRSKDIIIRGGENVPVVEIENLLYGHPAIQDVAIVAMPDDRLGERACAYLTLKEGAGPLALADIVAFLKDRKVAAQYLPEEAITIDAMPRTPSGKIQKVRLREMAASVAEAQKGGRQHADPAVKLTT